MCIRDRLLLLLFLFLFLFLLCCCSCCTSNRSDTFTCCSRLFASKSGKKKPQFYKLLTRACASRHNGVQFFDIAARSNRQKLARTCGNFNIFHENVLGATTACTFSTSHCPEVARTCGNFNIFHENALRATAACTFFTSQLPKVVRT